jgi:gas vesicle protein
MGNLLYVIAVIKVLAWQIGFVGFHSGGITQVLPFKAFSKVIIKIEQKEKFLNNSRHFRFIFVFITKKKTMKTGKLLLGVLAGVAAGALLGILFAPEKGSATRKKITEKGEDYADSLKDKFNKFVDSIVEKYESVKEDLVDSGEEGKKPVDEV